MRVGIIGAMEEEVNELRGKMVEPVVETVAHCTFTLGKIEGVEVVLTLCGIGKANAAMATALLNDRYRPDYVVNTGVAGGVHEAMAVGDIVISTEVRYHDVDATVFGYEYGQVPGSVPAYMPAKKLIDIAKQAAQEVGIRTETGLVLTGDSFMGEATRVQQVKGQFPTAYCVEMEAGAIAQVCHQFETPFVIIRALSDVAGGEAHGSYETFLKKAADHSAQQVLHMLRALAA